MKTILVLGAGRSSASLIDYLLQEATGLGATVTVGDVSAAAAQERVGGSPQGKAIEFDINAGGADEIINRSDIVVSILPASLHPLVARKCLQFKKHLVTASYVSNEMRSFDEEVAKSGLLFLNECGLDPGIDHMSAMHVIDRIKRDGGDLYSFESFTGGLIAPETDPENPWRYKFTWNPRNVVMAGQSAARFLQNGQYKYIPYQQLFKRITPVSIKDVGEFEGYANRDSLSYRKAYGLEKIQTMLRGTLRNKGFCAAWDILVQLGCTDDSYEMEDVAHLTHHDFVNAFLDFHPEWSCEEKIAAKFHVKQDGPELQRLNWSGLFDNEPVGLQSGTPAQILEHILNKRWKLSPHDRDQIVMWHRFRFRLEGQEREIQATLIATGTDAIHTAMARTVGLPMGIAAMLLLQGKIKSRGVRIPVIPEIYAPILKELEGQGITLEERER